MYYVCIIPGTQQSTLKKAYTKICQIFVKAYILSLIAYQMVKHNHRNPIHKSFIIFGTSVLSWQAVRCFYWREVVLTLGFLKSVLFRIGTAQFECGTDAENLDAFAGQLFFGIVFHTGHSQKVYSRCAFSCEWWGYCSAKMTCCRPRTCVASRL